MAQVAESQSIRTLALLERYQAGDNFAAETLLTEFRRLIHWHADAAWRKRRSGVLLDFDDAHQIASTGFLRAAQRFRPDRKASFPGFAGRVMQNALSNAFSRRAVAVMGQASWDGPSSERSHPVASMDRHPPATDDWWKDTLRELPEIARQVMLLRFREQMKLADVGLAVGLSESRCSTIVRETAELIRKRDQGLTSSFF